MRHSVHESAPTGCIVVTSESTEAVRLAVLVHLSGIETCVLHIISDEDSRTLNGVLMLELTISSDVVEAGEEFVPDVVSIVFVVNSQTLPEDLWRGAFRVWIRVGGASADADEEHHNDGDDDGEDEAADLQLALAAAPPVDYQVAILDRCNRGLHK